VGFFPSNFNCTKPNTKTLSSHWLFKLNYRYNCIPKHKWAVATNRYNWPKLLAEWKFHGHGLDVATSSWWLICSNPSGDLDCSIGRENSALCCQIQDKMMMFLAIAMAPC
jgi:hypothetical protein